MGKCVKFVIIKAGQMDILSVPDHKEIGKETLRSMIRSSGLMNGASSEWH